MKKIHASFLPAVIVGIASILVSGIACADNEYISNNGDASIDEIVDGTTMTTFIPTSPDLQGPTGLAIFGNDLYVANNALGTVAEFSLSNGAFIGNYVTGLFNPRGITFDSAGNLYIANQSSGSVIKVLAGSPLDSTGAVFASGFSFPNGLVIVDNNLYVANGQGASLDQVSLSTGTVTVPTFVTGLSNPNGLATKTGAIFETNTGTSEVLEFDTTGTFTGVAVSDPTNMLDAKGLTIDSAGDFWVTDEGIDEVTEYSPAGVLIGTFKGFIAPNYITTQVTVPEPSTCALLVASVGMLVFIYRRKKATV